MEKIQIVQKMVKVLIDYTKKKHITASTAILTDYAEELYEEGYCKQEWISVDEALPEQGAPVLVYKNRNSDAYGNMETAYFDNGRWRGACGAFITHWMPFPEAPKGGTK